MNKLNELLREGVIEDSLYKEKLDLLKEHFKDLFSDTNKKKVTKMKKSEFLDLLKMNAIDYIIPR